MSMLLSLPLELLDMIIGDVDLTTNDHKHLRLVCRSLASLVTASGCLFQSATLTAHRAHFASLVELSAHVELTRHVRTLTFDCLQFQQVLPLEEGLRPRRWQARWYAQSWLYNPGVLGQVPRLWTSHALYYLRAATRILSGLPNLRTVCFTDGSYEPDSDFEDPLPESVPVRYQDLNCRDVLDTWTSNIYSSHDSTLLLVKLLLLAIIRSEAYRHLSTVTFSLDEEVLSEEKWHALTNEEFYQALLCMSTYDFKEMRSVCADRNAPTWLRKPDPTMEDPPLLTDLDCLHILTQQDWIPAHLTLPAKKKVPIPFNRRHSQS